MITPKMKDDYDDYLARHTKAVRDAFEWMLINLPELFVLYDADELGHHISLHDRSKWHTEEYEPYCEYFYGHHQNDPDVQNEFDLAWLHHQHRNPHHWQHWVLREDDGSLKLLEMPHLYVIEMVCDHWSFSWMNNNLHEIFNWYYTNKNREKMVLHPKTRELYESILEKIFEKMCKKSSKIS